VETRTGFSVPASKILYLMRPHLVPIIDSRLSALYDDAAAVAAANISARRPAVASKWNYWAAIRLDVLAASEWLVLTRKMLGSGTPTERRASEILSDVRLLDLVSWTP
jgi:hypothetical protein